MKDKISTVGHFTWTGRKFNFFYSKNAPNFRIWYLDYVENDFSPNETIACNHKSMRRRF